ncbi:oxoglutarate dehydrogenase (succinyl-transferring), E1 component [Brevibacillus laterosporus GI-9]|uniref:2-oxoglutarate dehydrogenase E1 component n=1 Tax=Brevibacillus laterosporus TaxID=1465 RepID=UPI0002404AD4|nr:2-oxoglutarate dehydrogenase E1 component [Brevibacillus laterosporus]CCF13248.1 oxoglutarate dehydrogenase (succinyl-transferring), E1 component [Brevibacillus laterosporus GI-9]
MSMNNKLPASPWAEFYGPNLGYVFEQYEIYMENPEEVPADLRKLFDNWGSPVLPENDLHGQEMTPESSAPRTLPFAKMKKFVAALQLADTIRGFGHLGANLYPLEAQAPQADLLNLDQYGLTEADLRDIPAEFICKHQPERFANGWEAIQYLKGTYTSNIAFEIQHVDEAEEKAWIQSMIESGEVTKELSLQKKTDLLKRLNEVEGFEKFLHKQFVGAKRFSVEGLDVLVPVIDELVEHSVQAGTSDVTISMAHRGRLNVLTHVLGKPYEDIFSQFQHSPKEKLDKAQEAHVGWTGDVKYHFGAVKEIKNGDKTTRITMAHNPSHLEVSGSIVQGYTRAAQDDRSQAGYPKQDEYKAMSILVHGDAAFPGQGVVAETLNYSGIKGYKTGGTVHIIANNRVGFTTESEDSRSTRYASDLAKGYGIPIIHVNADDPEACIAAAKLAFEYRSKFYKDVLIDLIGYRRLGHNEMDEPMATNPMTYIVVRKHPTITQIYKDRLTERNELSKEQIEAIEETVKQAFVKAYEKVNKAHDDSGLIPDLPDAVKIGYPKVKTSVDLKKLTEINADLLKWPEGFHVFDKLEKILSRRQQVFTDNSKIDWAHAEVLAFSTILEDGTPIRLSGQDSERGTFSHRNLVLHDSKTGETYSPLHRLPGAKASFEVRNSPLSEYAVLGFEYGYNVFAPETLVMWEAQFGDFANTAQVIFDQYISAGRAKWGQKSGLVMLLPHGYEGQGPEHSSARLERFLQLSAENNWTVANLSSSAQYFHILRRQAAMLNKDEVRPLVIMSPKSLLRNPSAGSAIDEFTNGEFKTVIEQPDLGQKPEAVERLVFCTGRMAVDLSDQVADVGKFDWLQIVRVEELYPFPTEKINEIIRKYKNLREIIWTQEEPRNMGAWTFVEPRLKALAPKGVNVSYNGRMRRSSPSEGDPVAHKKEQQRILAQSVTRNLVRV